jgi:CheY-like chemotaxis protein
VAACEAIESATGLPEADHPLARELPRAVEAKRILIVDDNVDAAESLGRLLEACGHEIIVFHDPVDVLRALPGLELDAAILDIGLPVIDGYELGAKVRQHCGDRCHLVALTGYGQSRSWVSSIAA